MELSTLQAAILVVLGLLRTRVRRTKLVKLMYLADNRFYELNGVTLTGLAYMWDRYGPNAVSNAIVKEADQLVSQGKVNMAVQSSPYGTDSYLYWVPKTTELQEEGFARVGPGAGQVLRDVVKEFGDMAVQRLVAVSKRTEPFQKAGQYEVLELQANPDALELQRRVSDNEELIAAAKRGLKDIQHGRLISQEELDRSYEERR